MILVLFFYELIILKWYQYTFFLLPRNLLNLYCTEPYIITENPHSLEDVNGLYLHL